MSCKYICGKNRDITGVILVICLKGKKMSECAIDSQCCTCLWPPALKVSGQLQEGSVPLATAQNQWFRYQPEPEYDVPFHLDCQYWEGGVKEANTRNRFKISQTRKIRPNKYLIHHEDQHWDKVTVVWLLLIFCNTESQLSLFLYNQRHLTR